MTLAGAVARRLVLRALGGLTGGTLVLRHPDGRGLRFGDGHGPTVVVDLIRPDAVWERLGRRTRVGFGEAYVAGDWDTDDLVGLLTLLGRALERLDGHAGVGALRRLQRLRPDASPRQTERRARGSIQAHYDLGNGLFALMLDETMTYSCALWESPEQSLAEAQRAKLRRVCAKLRLGPDDHLLEIGCGWGSLAITAASEHGCRVTGLTLSPSQAALARERVREAGVDGLVEIREQDYRTVEGTYSKIASIEMLEAIGHAEHPTYFRTLDRLLADRGLALVQTIGVPDDRYERYRRTPDWIQEHVFPGSLLPSLEALARAVGRTRLMVLDLEEIGISYARTLREWRERFTASLDRVRALGYDERFVRTWTFYLAFCEAGFAIRHLRDMQLVLSRPFNDALPEHPSAQVAY